MLSKISLRLRLTILTYSILVVACACLTTVSVFNAGNMFLKPIKALSVQPTVPKPIISDTETDENVPPTTAYIYDMLQESKKGFTLQSILVMVAITGIGTILTWFVAGKALKPVTTLSKTVEDIDVNNLSTQIPVPYSKDEVARLTYSFNNMLTKISMAFESQKRFAQNAAHELKTPLSAMLTNIEVMEIDEDSASIEEYKENLLIVKQNVERMTALVTDLLALNVEKNHMDISRFSIRDLFVSILNDNDNDIKKKNISVNINGEREINGNRFMLERAFSNIVQNAIRYNHNNGSIIIYCSESGITISDTGIGIPSDKLPHIFEPFYCVDASRSRALGGSGLGLAITKEIFDKNGIKIDVVSTENKGTIFTVTNL
ncbi:sensor histidine kinase [Anaerocolumna sp. MB42-C2]|uniref:sensor histidine kinase n=1 Tax=Anaerocolumna sp. MB42-C2 TaxID=3070997 RepID=UPI0027DF6501|nr:HAMP domain-containing sensor histidine kinase [Anaerocolumna sp. MB42-C2]WMJ90523.1 HAMP domain-containing sensor histidine kinase [Anaerocolumna sp. MB42-C2]